MALSISEYQTNLNTKIDSYISTFNSNNNDGTIKFILSTVPSGSKIGGITLTLDSFKQSFTDNIATLNSYKESINNIYIKI